MVTVRAAPKNGSIELFLGFAYGMDHSYSIVSYREKPGRGKRGLFETNDNLPMNPRHCAKPWLELPKDFALMVI